MEFIADLHLHSRFSIATSKDMDLPHLNHWAQLKGISVLAAGDGTHPKWFREMRELLARDESGLYVLKDRQDPNGKAAPDRCRQAVFFIPSAEVSTIYKKDGKVRKVHHLLLFPDLDSLERLSRVLDGVGNIRSDGRPILKLDSRDLLQRTLDISPDILFIPAHVWTPHFSVLGAGSGFDSLEECYGDLAGKIPALETGLSSDPPMNRRVSKLDSYLLVSNSDAHSPSKLGRNANRFDTERSYWGIRNAIQTGSGFLETLEMYPQEGKYHLDGHRTCRLRLTPRETIQYGSVCPVCKGRITVGVMHRVEDLADRPEGGRLPGTPSYRYIVPLQEIVAETLRVGVSSRKVNRRYREYLEALGPEFRILLDCPREELEHSGSELLAEAVTRVREGDISVTPGFDGQYGRIRIFEQADRV